MIKKDTRTDPQLKIRIPPELKQQIDKSAKDNHRTLNGEIVAMLQFAYDMKNKTTDNQDYEAIARRVAREEFKKLMKK